MYSYCNIFAYKGFINISGCLMYFVFIVSRKQHTHSPLDSDMSYLVDPRPAQPVSALRNRRNTS